MPALLLISQNLLGTESTAELIAFKHSVLTFIKEFNQIVVTFSPQYLFSHINLWACVPSKSVFSVLEIFVFLIYRI